MINILSLRCSLAFAPYLAESAPEFLRGGLLASRVVRQGGTALIIRSDGDVALRHQDREAFLSRDEAVHYFATIQFRSEVYDVLRMQDEVVLANVGNELLLSHPQSYLWLECDTIVALSNAFNSGASSIADEIRASLPDWLTVSTGGGRLLLSDQRTARWVLLGDDHIRELDRRLEALRAPIAAAPRLEPPTIALKGLPVHLQSAFKLLATLERFVDTDDVEPFEEITPIYSLTASRSTEGIEFRNSEMRIALTPREARKWVGIMRAELDSLNARQVERGGIRTVFAVTGDGQWVLQWGDEVFIPKGAGSLLSSRGEIPNASTNFPMCQKTTEFLLLLSHGTGACVALTHSESACLNVQSE